MRVLGLIGDGGFDEGVELAPCVEAAEGVDGFFEVLAGLVVRDGHEFLLVVGDGFAPEAAFDEAVVLLAEGCGILREERGGKDGEENQAEHGLHVEG